MAEARAALASHDFQLCLTDMRLPDGDGLDIVRHIGEAYAHLPVAVITAYGSAENAVAALKAGAFDYLAKPIGLEQLRNLVQAALRLPGTEEAVGTAEQEGPELLGASPAMQQVRAMIEKLARSQAPVYISGESGSGKEVAARLIHARSARSAGPFVPVNCGAIPENLMESEFFGYRKGAFTGADSDRDGFFQAAHGGTLFLDEVADLPLSMQVKLLRAIQEKKVRKVGQVSEEPVDLRILCATHRNLRECVESGKFRQDLYYRLNVIELRMPPLRERSEDIEALAGRILKRLAGPEHPLLSAQALVGLMAYAFPDNVRELENILERATALCAEGVILPEDLQLEAFAAPGGAVAADAMNWSAPARQAPLAERLRAIESALLRHVMSEAADNAEQAAETLHVSVESLQARLARNA